MRAFNISETSIFANEVVKRWLWTNTTSMPCRKQWLLSGPPTGLGCVKKRGVRLGRPGGDNKRNAENGTLLVIPFWSSTKEKP